MVFSKYIFNKEYQSFENRFVFGVGDNENGLDRMQDIKQKVGDCSRIQEDGVRLDFCREERVR